MCAERNVWTNPKESLTLPLGEGIFFQIVGLFRSPNKRIFFPSFYACYLPLLQLPRICMFCFSYHFRPKFCVLIVRHITWNSVAEIYVTVMCLVYLLHIPKVLSSKLGGETTYTLWGFVYLSIATPGELRWANVECGVHLCVLWIPFRYASCWQCIYVHSLALLNRMTPNVNYSVRTAPLTSKFAFYIFIKQI